MFNKTTKFRRLVIRLHWVLLLWTFSGTLLSGGAIQSHESIRKAAVSHVQQGIGQTDGKLTVIAGQLDNRLSLDRCDTPLKAFSPSGRQSAARKTVGIRCLDEKGWTIYLPVTFSLMRPVVTAGAELPAKHLITTDDLQLELRDVAQLSRGHYEKAQPVVGKRLRRTVHRGDVIIPSLLKTTKTIKRGSRVTILGQVGAIQVRMVGKALGDGATGERIKVINESSNRKLEATVVNAGLVKVVL